jgi:hypothetical protein
MKILYIKNGKKIVETPEEFEEGKKRYEILCDDVEVSDISFIDTIDYPGHIPICVCSEGFLESEGNFSV